jgi:hypothetical protein
VESLAKSKDSARSWARMILAKMMLAMYLGSLIADQAAANPKLPVLDEVCRVLGWFEDYRNYAKSFRPEAALATAQGADAEGKNETSQGDGSGLALDTNEVIEGLTQGMSKVGPACLDFLYNTFAGAHDSTLKALAAAMGYGRSSIQWSAAASSEFGTALSEAIHLLSLHKQAVGLDAEAPPLLGPLAVAPPHIRGGQGRQPCGAVRTGASLANLAACRYPTAVDLQRFCETKCGAAYSFVGKPAEAPALAPRFRSV